MEIIRGTTPTFTFSFTDINASNIAAAYFIIMQGKTKKIEKQLDDALLNDGKLLFTLSQTETLGLSTDQVATLVLDWKTTAGIRGRSKVYEATISNSGKDEVI